MTGTRLRWSGVGIVIVAAVLFGMLLIGLATYYEAPQETVPTKVMLTVVHELGVAFIIAALVAIVFHLREFAEFFEALAGAVMLEDKFLARLKDAELRRMRQRAATQLVSRFVSSRTYDQEQLTAVMDTVVFDATLPGGTASGEYRINFAEQYHLTWLTKTEFVRELGLDQTEGRLIQDDQMFLKRENIVSYEVVSPQSDPEPFRIPLELEVAPLIVGTRRVGEKQVRLWAGSAQANAVPIAFTSRPEPNGEVTFTPTPIMVPFRLGRAEVWYRLIDYGYADQEPFLLSTMEVPTKPKQGLFATITFQGRPGATAKCRVLGVGGNFRLELFPHGGHVSYDGGWFLAKQGYVVWW